MVSFAGWVSLQYGIDKVSILGSLGFPSPVVDNPLPRGLAEDFCSRWFDSLPNGIRDEFGIVRVREEGGVTEDPARRIAVVRHNR